MEYEELACHNVMKNLGKCNFSADRDVIVSYFFNIVNALVL